MDGRSSENQDHHSREEQMWSTILKTWETLYSDSLSPENAESMIHCLQQMPEISSKLIEVGLDGAAHMLQQWGERIMALHLSDAEPGSARDLNEAFLQHWTQWYEMDKNSGRALYDDVSIGRVHSSPFQYHRIHE